MDFEKSFSKEKKCNSHDFDLLKKWTTNWKERPPAPTQLLRNVQKHSASILGSWIFNVSSNFFDLTIHKYFLCSTKEKTPSFKKKFVAVWLIGHDS